MGNPWVPATRIGMGTKLHLHMGMSFFMGAKNSDKYEYDE